IRMSSSSRIPLATSSSVNRESALVRATAQKIKRRSIGQNLASTAKKPRTTATPTVRATSGPSSSLISRTQVRPLSQASTTGRVTIASMTRPSLRPPTSSATTRQRTSVSGFNEENEEMKKKIKELETNLNEKEGKINEMKKRLEETTERLEETKARLEEVKEEKKEAREAVVDLKSKLAENKSELIEAKATVKELKLDLKTEKEEHEATKKENEEMIGRLKREVIQKDDQMRQLHNDVVDLKGRIRVSVRVRPLLETERGESTDHLSYPDETTVGLEQQKGKVAPFSFNHVYGPTYSQLRIFDGVKDLILSVLHGYNVSLISYGQTGSGKTHTMRGGDGESAGLIPRAVKFLFENRSRLEDLDWSFDFAASFLEVYNNECFDLLSMPPRAKREIKQMNNKFVVEGLTMEPITDVMKMTSLLRKSDGNRSTAATKCNETSSRSHAIFALSVNGTNRTTGAKIDCVLKLVDLAGSERANESGATGERFTELTHINTALSNLQNCIRSILSKQSHVPYRNSKLTTLLQDSLSGGSKCMVILSLSPQLTTIHETRRTLEFGRNLSQTHIGAAKKKET
ncbi:hypothetical protein PMAYCL1PPCAC_02134, partial [Pristionchus mayeri]